MSFQFSEKHIEEYNTQGFTVFRGLVPPTLIDDLRRECDKGAAQVRAKSSGQAQRFQPISKFDVDQKPFQDYGELPELRDALARVLSPEHQPGTLDVLGVLIEPTELPWCTSWHRDWRDNMQGLDIAKWEKVLLDKDMFNQVNCALYEDTCTWVVPGSHARPDTPEEIARFPQRGFSGPDLEGKSSAERERLSLEYCQSLPGAFRLLLDAGDYALYRNSLWHLGNYIPSKKRATLHDAVDTQKFIDWRAMTMEDIKSRRAAGLGWDNSDRIAV